MNAKIKFLGVAGMATLMLASCSKDEIQVSNPGDEITFNSNVTRATETTTSSLKSIKVYADAVGYNKMFIDGDVATKKDGEEVFRFSKNYYWPSDVNTIRFWAYGPSDIDVKPTITADGQSFGAYTPKSGVENPGAEHKDLVVAFTESERTSGSNVSLKFHHAFTQVVVNAKAGMEDPSRTISIKGAWIVNVQPTGLLAFSETATDNNYMSWSVSGQKTYYGLTLGTPLTLTHELGTVIGGSDKSNLMLIPQTLDKWDLKTDKPNAAKGAYILLLCRIEIKHAGAEHPGASEGGPVFSDGEFHYHQLFPESDVYNKEAYGYTCVPIDTDWKAGKKYVYNLEFCGVSSGAGLYPPTVTEPFPLENVVTTLPDGKNIGDPVLDDPIRFTVTVDDWTDATENNDTPMN